MRARTTLKRKKRSRKNTGGFTLVEIMIVVLIIGILLNIATPGFIHARDSSWQKACCANLHNIELAKEQFAIDNNSAGTYTPVWSDLSPYLESGYTEPLCPATGAVYDFNEIDTEPVCTYGGPPGLPHALLY